MRALTVVLLAALAAPALADTAVSDLVAAQGLGAAESQLAALPSPTPSDRFALGGVRFLRGVERALQLRYRVGISQGMAVMSDLPILRLPIPENPSPEPFEPAAIDQLFRDVETDMAGAIEALSGIADGDEVGVKIALDDLWFDIDADGARTPGEGLMEVALSVFLGSPTVTIVEEGTQTPDAEPLEIRFDTADAAWLSAYAHLLAGLSEGILALDPAGAVARVTESRETFDALGRPAPMDGMMLDQQFSDIVDLVAIFVLAIEGQPDAVRTRAFRDHLLAMVAENRRFWTLVAREQDNDREWIPNKNQISATGLPFPPDIGARWLAVLSDAEAVLNGDLLIPFWRVGPGAGLDLHAFLESPPPLDVAGLIQGSAFTAYLRAGPLADLRNVMLFEQMVSGDSAFYAIVLN